MEADRPLPQPITPEAKPYWDGAREGKLMVPKCQACGKAFLYPRVLCPFCSSRDIGWIQASGRGTLHSFEIAHQILNKAFKVKTPVVLAMVELEEGPRMLHEPRQRRARSQRRSAATCRWRSSSRSSPTRSPCRCSSRPGAGAR